MTAEHEPYRQTDRKSQRDEGWEDRTDRVASTASLRILMHRATTAAIVNSQLAYLGGHLGELASSANLMRCAAAAAIEQVRRR